MGRLIRMPARPQQPAAPPPNPALEDARWLAWRIARCAIPDRHGQPAILLPEAWLKAKEIFIRGYAALIGGPCTIRGISVQIVRARQIMEGALQAAGVRPDVIRGGREERDARIAWMQFASAEAALTEAETAEET